MDYKDLSTISTMMNYTTRKSPDNINFILPYIRVLIEYKHYHAGYLLDYIFEIQDNLIVEVK